MNAVVSLTAPSALTRITPRQRVRAPPRPSNATHSRALEYGSVDGLTDVTVRAASPLDAAASLYSRCALEPSSAGTVTLDGVNPFALSERELAVFRNRRVGFIFQDHLLLPQCTVLENVLVPTLVGEPETDAHGRARELLERVGLADRLDHRPAELSGGERQRVSLARALIRRPPLLLCDEPTGNLDHASGNVVASMLFDLHQQQNTILLIVTHNSALAARCPIRFELVGDRLQRVDGAASTGSGDDA